MNANYQAKLEEGLRFQDHVLEVLLQEGIPLMYYTSREKQKHGETANGIEVKYDRRCKETGNLYIEYAEKSSASNANYVPSGIDKDDNTWLWVIGNYETLYILCKSHLRRVKTKYKPVNTPTSLGFLLPVADAEVLAAKIITTDTPP